VEKSDLTIKKSPSRDQHGGSRKQSFDTQTAAGGSFVETMLTNIETCRQQDRNVLAFATDAIRARGSSRNSRHLRRTEGPTR
jgi:hypothetical protein